MISDPVNLHTKSSYLVCVIAIAAVRKFSWEVSSCTCWERLGLFQFFNEKSFFSRLDKKFDSLSASEAITL